jgi:hypothetical protein
MHTKSRKDNEIRILGLSRRHYRVPGVLSLTGRNNRSDLLNTFARCSAVCSFRTTQHDMEGNIYDRDF